MRPPLEAVVALGVALAVATPGCTEEAAQAPPEPDLAANEALRLTIAPLLSVTIERSCPPPGILGCGPALRIAARPPDRAPRELSRGLAAIVPVALRAAGYRDLRLAPMRSGKAGGRVISAHEVLARWRVEPGGFELVTDGLELGDRNAAALLAADGGGSAAGGLRIEVNEATLAEVLHLESP